MLLSRLIRRKFSSTKLDPYRLANLSEFQRQVNIEL